MDPMSREGLERLRTVLAERIGVPVEHGPDPGRVEPLRRQVLHAVTGIDAYLTAVEAGSPAVVSLRVQAVDLWQVLVRLAAEPPEPVAAAAVVRVPPPSPVPRIEQDGGATCLRSETVRVGGALVCSFNGDMTLDSEHVAAWALSAALDQRPDLLAVDMAGVELLTSSGLNVMLTARGRAVDTGIPLVLVAPSRVTLRVLELTDTTALFPSCATTEDAVRYRRPPVPRP
ncbi:STAS domain-containing protein [Kitasatospora sp. NPDC048365]|uniref:STAS domain-containing protein n=1 Tax=Kitasatospora sp. NPDC048365 TaxID=3364050 RepID=UPI003719AB9F